MRAGRRHEPPFREERSPAAHAAPPSAAGWGRGRVVAVRVLAVLGLLTYSFMLVFVMSDAVGRTGETALLEPAGSAEAQVGADHPGETVHVVGAMGALAIGASGLIGLIVRPQRAGSVTQTGATAIAMLTAVLLVGDPDNFGGQAAVVDVAFLVMVIPVVAAAATAVPWREWLRRRGIERPRLLALAALALPAAAYGVDQALMQRNTWPPAADPHHQAHWYAMAVLGLIVVPVVAGAALPGRGWRVATTAVSLAATSVAVASLVAPTAGSALHQASAVATLVWGLALLALTWNVPTWTRNSRAPASARVRPDASLGHEFDGTTLGDDASAGKV